ncbi:MAG: hypothetical protein FWE87_01395 [Coriobacteriia bacterium]|nr:hypothetical protein [Coriobacteriia bacterium]
MREDSSMWSDPVVRVLGVLVVLVIIGGLMTLVSMLVTGVLPLAFSPQTSQDADIAQYQSIVEANQDPESWSRLIIALGNSGKMNEARKQLEAFRVADLDMTQTQAVAYAEASLLMMEDKYDEALLLLQKMRADLWEAYETELASEGEKNWAIAFGIPQNYFQATLDIAHIFIAQNRDAEALEMLDDYLSKLPTDASTLITRGKLKLRMNDIDGAEQDFLAAQRFLPDEEEILKGLEEIEARR